MFELLSSDMLSLWRQATGDAQVHVATTLCFTSWSLVPACVTLGSARKLPNALSRRVISSEGMPVAGKL